jgi:hypothetical protein
LKKKAPFNDVWNLLPILGDQLVNLDISAHQDVEAFLFRHIRPEGLPNLRSLGIFQEGVGHLGPRLPDGLSPEAVEGFRRMLASLNPRGVIDEAYVRSLADRAPNLEELELIGVFPESLVRRFVCCSPFSH